MWQDFIQPGFRTQQIRLIGYHQKWITVTCTLHILLCNSSGLCSVVASYLSHWCYHRYYLWHHSMAMALLEWCVVSWYFMDSSNGVLVNIEWFECLEGPWIAQTAWPLDSIHLLAPFYTTLNSPTMPPFRHFLLSAKMNNGHKGTQWYAKRHLSS